MRIAIVALALAMLTGCESVVVAMKSFLSGL
jgi:hypothetical protein